MDLDQGMFIEQEEGWDSHTCYALMDGKDCDYGSQYFNWLACSCFERDQCKKGCPGGQ